MEKSELIKDAGELAHELGRIGELRKSFGERLVILTHHYQRPEIVALGDLRGDSFLLSKQAAANAKAEFIMFCGVRFMAESAVILAREGQRVYHPNPESGCPMADMARLDQVALAWREIGELLDGELPIPVAYVNTSAEVKAFTGRHGGICCTSSCARPAMEWAFSRKGRVLFLPDEHLGRNTALAMGIPAGEIVEWDYRDPCGGAEAEAVRKAKVILWKGHCHVHTRFTTAHIEEMRAKVPEAKVVVHPECAHDVVQAADGAGSTEFIVKYVHQAGPGATIAVGTEINLIRRLAGEYPDRQVLPLYRSLCPNMFKISLGHLMRALEGLPDGPLVTLSPGICRDARLALERMLAIL